MCKQLAINFSFYVVFDLDNKHQIFGFFAFLYLFYPLTGCLADIRCGRYKTITGSLWFIIWGGMFATIGAI